MRLSLATRRPVPARACHMIYREACKRRRHKHHLNLRRESHSDQLPAQLATTRRRAQRRRLHYRRQMFTGRRRGGIRHSIREAWWSRCVLSYFWWWTMYDYARLGCFMVITWVIGHGFTYGVGILFVISAVSGQMQMQVFGSGYCVAFFLHFLI